MSGGDGGGVYSSPAPRRTFRRYRQSGEPASLHRDAQKKKFHLSPVYRRTSVGGRWWQHKGDLPVCCLHTRLSYEVCPVPLSLPPTIMIITIKIIIMITMIMTMITIIMIIIIIMIKVIIVHTPVHTLVVDQQKGEVSMNGVQVIHGSFSLVELILPCDAMTGRTTLGGGCEAG